MRDKLQRLWIRFGQEETGQRGASIAALIIFGIGLLTSVAFAGMVADQSRKAYVAREAQHTANLTNSFTEKITGYEQLLLAGSTLFGIRETVSREDWVSFMDGMRIGERFPNTVGSGFVENIPAERLAEHEERVRQEGLPEYSVRPRTPERETYTSILYLEPQTKVNQLAIGYDMFSEPNRNKAMSIARDEARIAVTAPVIPIQDSIRRETTYKGVLLYYPVYANGSVPNSVEERRATIRGYIYVIIRPGEIIKPIAEKLPRPDDRYLILSDLSSGSDKPFLNLGKHVPSTGAKSIVQTDFIVANHRWRLSVYDTRSQKKVLLGPLAVFISGTALSAVAAAYLFNMISKRLRNVHSGYEQELQRTKDELLALASHQLRTPASGVKQYLGMLTQGMIGPLSEEQHEIASKAYAANERQLEIINELLYVAKADAGQLMMMPEKLDVTALTRDVINSVHDKAIAKAISLHFSSHKPCYVYGDPRYIRMIIENLLTNAIKYSYASSKVRLKLQSIEHTVTLAVNDGGVGIPAGELDNIFDKFQRVENPLSREEGGSGLGLFLARELARAHHGEITVTSKLDKGSTFVLSLPAYSPLRAKKRSVAKLGGHQGMSVRR